MRQPGEVNDPDAVYTTVADLERGALGVYGSWNPLSEIEFNSVFTDEVAIGYNNGGQGINDGLYTFILQAGSDAPASIWGGSYAVINFANRILEAAENITPANAAEQADYDRIIAEMKGVRAYMHFNLLSYFSEDLTSDSSLGVMIVDFVPDYTYTTQLPRSTNGEVFAFIEQDLTDLMTTLNTSDYADWNAKKDRINIHFANALRARMNIYRERYDDALTYASKFVNASNTNALPQFPNVATTNAAWAAMLADTADGDVIFKLKEVFGGPQVGALFNSSRSDISGSNFYELSRSLYNLFNENQGDIRRGAGVGTNIIDGTSKVEPYYESIGDYRSRDILVINKYPGNTAQDDPLLNDFFIFRLGEMYMIKAEALVGKGQLNGSSNSAAATMRRFRQLRGAGTAAISYANATAAWADILKERRRELALEGHRWLDIKRLGEKAGGLGVDRYSRDCEQYNSCTLAPTSYKFTLPIPTSEIIANSNISGQQNTGY